MIGQVAVEIEARQITLRLFLTSSMRASGTFLFATRNGIQSYVTQPSVLRRKFPQNPSDEMATYLLGRMLNAYDEDIEADEEVVNARFERATQCARCLLTY